MGPLEFLYYIGYSIKKWSSLKNQKSLPHKVISIGNITVGGTGKTPAVIAIAEEAIRRGFKPCILTRGYRGKAKGPCFVNAKCGMWNAELSNSELRTQSPKSLIGDLNSELYGDEPVLMAERLKDVPVVKCADRYEGGLFALNSLPITHYPLPVFILDDGFQHWKLFRDKNILLVDGTDPFGDRKLLPVGRLREPLKEMRRADIIVITKNTVGSRQSAVNSRALELRTKNLKLGTQKHKAESLINEIKEYNSGAPIFFAGHKPSFVRTISGQEFPPDWLSGKDVYGFCGIGNPYSFRDTLSSTGARLMGFRAYRDHHRYSRWDVERIIKESQRSNAEWIATTEKDIMRLKGLDLPENLVLLGIEFSVDKRFYEEVFSEIKF